MAFTIGISDETFYNIGQCVMHTKLGGVLSQNLGML